ncbi:MAG: ABC transporter permease [Bacteroidota bacterium]
MNSWERWVAFRLVKNKNQTFSKNMMILAISAVALSVCVMIITISTVRGFQQGIMQKVIQLHGDFIIDNAANLENAEPIPFSKEKGSEIEKVLKSSDAVKSWTVSCSKAAIIKGEQDLDGVVATGMDFLQVRSILKPFIVNENHRLTDSNTWVWISKELANRLTLDTGSYITLVFFKNVDSLSMVRPKPKRLQIAGIFETGIDQIDKQIIYVNQYLVSEFLPNNNSITKIEVWAKPGKQHRLFDALKFVVPGGELRLNTSRFFHRQIYDWLSILNTNVWVILIMMAIVCFIAVTTILLILIFERIKFIGLIQAMGANVTSVQRVFLWQAVLIIMAGIGIGDLIAFVLCWLQETYQFIKLNQSIYFLSHVMVDFNWINVLIVNAGLIILSTIIALIPLQWIKRMALNRAIQY